ncbi:hypothetical protein D9M68_769750 [compost metagenome]
MLQWVLWEHEPIECGFSSRQIHGLLQYLEEEDSDGFLVCLQHVEKLQALDALQAQLADRRARLAAKIKRYMPLQTHLPLSQDLLFRQSQRSNDGKGTRQDRTGDRRE